jgi:dolichol-phosphate mannosyltransferase
MSRVLLTGAAGFIGANLARRLLADGHEVHVLVLQHHSTAPAPGRLHPHWRLADIWDSLQVHVASLADAGAVAKAVEGIRPERVFHLAAYGAYSWQDNAAEIIRVNLAGTVNLVEACLRTGFESLVNTGSSSEYGLKDHAPSEDEPADPNSPYASAKLGATLYCGLTARSNNVRISTLRLYSVYGPWEEPSRLVPTLAVRGLEGKLPPLVEPGVARDFVFVDDVVSAYLLASEKAGPGEVFNVGTGTQVTIAQAVEAARRVLSIKAAPEWGTMPNRSWDTTSWVANSAKLKGKLGWNTSVDFEGGFRLTADWLRGTPGMPELYRRGAVDGEKTG